MSGGALPAVLFQFDFREPFTVEDEKPADFPFAVVVFLQLVHEFVLTLRLAEVYDETVLDDIVILFGDSNGLGDEVCDLAEICFRHGFQFVQFVRFNPTISIHALREESDSSPTSSANTRSSFQSTLSVSVSVQ